MDYKRSYSKYFLIITLFFSFFLAQEVAAAPKTSRPNIIIFLSDDQHWNDLKGVMPQTETRIFKEGFSFTRAYISTPICCPSRAGILTGKYSTQHGVLGNSYPLKVPTIVDQLKAAGYFTGIMGKYLNSWNGSYRPEFDYWRVFKHGNADYHDTLFNENGTWQKKSGYISDILKEYAEEFLKVAKQSNKPFILFVTPQIPHRPAIPEDKYKNLFNDLVPYVPANAGCDKRKGKPNWIKQAPCQPKGRAGISKSLHRKLPTKRSKFQIRQRQTLKSFDDMIGHTLNQLAEQNLTENTALFYLSDNGLMRASFGLIGKMYPYEDSIKVPFAFSYPGLFKEQNRKIDQLVSNIDIAPTILELAGVEPDTTMAGKSLLTLLQNPEVNWRTEILIESQFRGKLDGVERVPFAGLRSKKYAFFVNRGDRPELYDMETDPDQLENIIIKRIEVARDLFRRLQVKRPDIKIKTWIAPRYQRFFSL